MCVQAIYFPEPSHSRLVAEQGEITTPRGIRGVNFFHSFVRPLYIDTRKNPGEGFPNRHVYLNNLYARNPKSNSSMGFIKTIRRKNYRHFCTNYFYTVCCVKKKKRVDKNKIVKTVIKKKYHHSDGEKRNLDFSFFYPQTSIKLTKVYTIYLSLNITVNTKTQPNIIYKIRINRVCECIIIIYNTVGEN